MYHLSLPSMITDTSQATNPWLATQESCGPKSAYPVPLTVARSGLFLQHLANQQDRKSSKAESFLAELRVRGVAIIKNVISEKETKTWTRELGDYVADNSPAPSSSAEKPELNDLFWSPAQLNSRAHPNVLAAQKFVMKGCWDERTKNVRGRMPSSARMKAGLQSTVSTNFPIVYADRFRIIRRRSELPHGGKPGQECDSDNCHSGALWSHSCGYGDRSIGSSKDDGPYHNIWSGNWEEHEPWDTNKRLDSLTPAVDANMQAHAYNCSTHSTPTGESTMFRMFQGMLCLSSKDTAGAESITRPMRICPLPLKLMTAYQLLRPFFSAPSQPPTEASSPTPTTTTTTTTTSSGSLDRNSLDTSSDSTPSPGSSHSAHRKSPLHEHGQKQGQNDHPLFHHHHHSDSDFDLENAFIALSPLLHPGDYLVWHPDMTCSVSASDSDDDDKHRFPRCYYNPHASSEPLFLSIPVCPLTQANALFLARQRRAFLLGFPGPQFVSEYAGEDKEIGESCHLGRPGVQQIYDVGREEALRAMGLLTWNEDESTCAEERQLLHLTNSILFPDTVKSMPR